MSKISTFILDFQKYKVESLRAWLLTKNVDLASFINKDQKIFSQFIRYFVFEESFGFTPSFIDKDGKPYLNDNSFFFNISHIKNHIIMVVADVEVGVDMEFVSTKRNLLGIAERYFSTDEYQSLKNSDEINKDFYTLWTLKEAQVKRSSLGIAKELSKAIFYKKQQWASEKYPNDFVTTFYDDLIISICCENVTDKQISFFKIENFEFKKLEVKGDVNGITSQEESN